MAPHDIRDAGRDIHYGNQELGMRNWEWRMLRIAIDMRFARSFAIHAMALHPPGMETSSHGCEALYFKKGY